MKNDGKNAKNEGEGKNPSPDSHSPHPIIPPRGDYQTLLSYQKAEVIYDLAFRFAHKFLTKSDRTIDQMIQSARSGKQSVLEGSKAALTSKETELKLTSVARASLEELLADYRDYLRVRDRAMWDKNSKEAQFVRRLGRKTPHAYELYREFVETRPPEVIANIAIASFTRPTICSTSNSAASKRISSTRRPARAHVQGPPRPSQPALQKMIAPMTPLNPTKSNNLCAAGGALRGGHLPLAPRFRPGPRAGSSPKRSRRSACVMSA